MASAAQRIIEALRPGGWEDDLPAPIVPCKARDKVPLVPWKKYQEVPPTVAQVKAWTKQFPDSNWALLTGQVSGIVVLDMDNYEVAMAWLAQNMYAEPRTVMVETSPEQYHYYLQWPGRTAQNFAKKIPGFDFRGDGGYVIAPFSTHPKGHQYKWVHGMDPSMQQVSKCPEWLLRELFGEGTDNHRPASENVVCTISWAGHDLDIPLSNYEKFIIDALAAGVSAGSRNQSGFCIGMTMLDLGYTQTDMDVGLRSWNLRCDPPLPEKEINRLIPSIIKYWTAKQQHQKTRENVIKDRKRGIDELSSFLGVEIKDVYQTPDEEKAITILAQYNGVVAKSIHSTIKGYRSWASDFARQTLIVPFLPEKVSGQFNNDFIKLLFGCARVIDIPEGATKEGMVNQAVESIIETGIIAESREEAGILLDNRGREYFQAFRENGRLYFHYADLKKHLSALTTDLIWDREVNKILNSLGFKQETIRIHERRSKAWVSGGN